MRAPAGYAGRGIRSSMTASRPARPMFGRRCRPTRNWGWCFCRRPRRVPISGAAIGRAITSMPTRSSRCGPRPANWSGPFRPCITTCGTTICRHSRRLPASIPAPGSATSSSSRPSKGFLFVLDKVDGPADLAGRGAPGAAGRCRGRAALADAAIPDPRTDAGAPAHFGRRRIWPGSAAPLVMTSWRALATRGFTRRHRPRAP